MTVPAENKPRQVDEGDLIQPDGSTSSPVEPDLGATVETPRVPCAACGGSCLPSEAQLAFVQCSWCIYCSGSGMQDPITAEAYRASKTNPPPPMADVACPACVDAFTGRGCLVCRGTRRITEAEDAAWRETETVRPPPPDDE